MEKFELEDHEDREQLQAIVDFLNMLSPKQIKALNKAIGAEFDSDLPKDMKAVIKNLHGGVDSIQFVDKFKEEEE